jgi:hypothetical protein
MNTKKDKIFTITIAEIKDVLGQDADLDNKAISEKLKDLDQYPRNIYNLDDLKIHYDLSEFGYEKAKQYVVKRNVQRTEKAKATRATNKKSELKKAKTEQPKLDTSNELDLLSSLYEQQAKIKVELAKLLQEKNLLEKQVLDLEKKLNVR